ncbi:MAG: oligoendopeptidase F [Oscillospiraceae bacterium]|jgi:oligoendopeptidase F|nr:oligoendopeptidase F [Oscillospiraceae bacterium]
MAQELTTRDKAEIRWTWDLSAIYPDHAAWDEACERARRDTEAFAAYAGTLGQSKTRLLEALDTYRTLHRRLDSVGTYAFLYRAQDNGDTQAQTMMDKIMNLVVDFDTQTAFLRPELLALPETLLADCASDAAFGEHDVFLRELLRDKPHTLTGAEEKLLSLFGEVADGAGSIVQMLTYVDMRFPDIAGEDGQPTPLTEGSYITYMQSPDRRVRQAAFEGVLGAYGALGNTFAAAYANNVKKGVCYAKARRFPGARAMALHPDEVPGDVYDSLVSAVRGRLPDLARYVALRRKALGVTDVHIYDLYAPMTKGFDIKLPYPEAYQLVVEALAPLGKDYTDTLQTAFAQRWIDAYENRGKTTGAFCSECYDAHPYVLLNYKPGLEGALTIAHEMGHAMHSHYSIANNCFAKYHYTIFVAEVASTVNEVLVLRHLLGKHPERAAQAALLNHLLEAFRTTVFRQTLFAEFEHKAHAMAEAGEALTRDSLCALYRQLNRDYYGAEAEVDACVADEWMRIPHFYNAFYVYKYATGFSAAVAIADKILTQGQPAVSDYLRFLSAGGSLPPMEELRIMGVDMGTPEPVDNALRAFVEMLGRFERLLD